MWLYVHHKSTPLIRPFWPNYSTRRSDSNYSLKFNNNMFLNNSYGVPPMNITLGSSYSAHNRIQLHQKLTHWKVRYQWNYSNFDGTKIQTTCSVDECTSTNGISFERLEPESHHSTICNLYLPVFSIVEMCIFLDWVSFGRPPNGQGGFH